MTKRKKKEDSWKETKAPPDHENNEDKLGRGVKLIMSFHPNPLQDSPSSSLSLKPTPPVPYPQKDQKINLTLYAGCGIPLIVTTTINNSLVSSNVA